MSGLLVFALLAAASVLLRLPSGRFPRRRQAEKPARAEADENVGITDPALMLDLAAAMLEAGQPLETVLALLADGAGPGVRVALVRVRSALALGAPWNTAWGPAISGCREDDAAVVAQLAAAFAFAGNTGAPSSAILLAHAAQLRRRRNRGLEKRAAALGVKLVIPLGVCALPAFICLGVLPVLFALVPAFG